MRVHAELEFATKMKVHNFLANMHANEKLEAGAESSPTLTAGIPVGYMLPHSPDHVTCCRNPCNPLYEYSRVCLPFAG